MEHVVDYKYNHENRLVKVTNNFATIQHHMSPNGKEITFTYDAMGRKVRKEITPFNQGQEKEVESYIYNGLGIDIIAEYQFKQPANNQAGRTERINEYYFGNGKLVAVKELKFNGSPTFNWNNDTAQSVAFYSQDALGSVALLSDWHGHTIEKFEYDVYGVYYAGKFDKSTPGQGQGCGIGWHSNPYGFTGKRFEAELGIYSFAFRDYSPRTFRWMTEDPIKDGVNWYGYCANNPLMFLDPIGLWISNADGTFTAEKGDTLWELQEETGGNSDSFDYKGDPKNLQIGQVVSLPINNINSGIVIDSNLAAIGHYYNGNGASANLGKNTINLLQTHPEQQRREQRILNGETNALSGFKLFSFAVSIIL